MITRREAGLDTAVVLLLCGVYVLVHTAGLLVRWIIPAVLVSFLLYALAVLRRRGDTWRDLGVRSDNLFEAGWRVGVWTLLGAALILAWAWWVGSGWRPELLVLLPLYPLWGILQQLIFQGILLRRLLVLVENRWVALIFTAILFGFVHLGNLQLVLLTALGGGVWSWFFQRWPNVLVLGASHGILAALAYPLLLSKNPLETF